MSLFTLMYLCSDKLQKMQQGLAKYEKTVRRFSEETELHTFADKYKIITHSCLSLLEICRHKPSPALQVSPSCLHGG